MNIGFIGAGKVSKAFGIYLENKGLGISGYTSRKFESAKEAASITASTAFKKYEDLAASCDIVIIATPDDAIQEVAHDISNCQGVVEGKVFIHMSGALSSSELDSLSKKGCGAYSLHPMLSFADIDESVEMLEHTIFTIEGNGLGHEKVEMLLKCMGNKVYNIDKSQKTLYHASACIASNYVIALMDFSLEMLKEIGIDEKGATEIIGGLAQGTISNMTRMGIDNAITGPISRGDAGTVRRHIDRIMEEKKSSLLDMYRTMGEKTLEIARRARLGDEKKANDIEKILKGEWKDHENR